MAERLSADRRAEARWGPLALAALMTGWSLWYFADAYLASARIQNLIFIAPAVTIVTILFAVVLITALLRRSDKVQEKDEQVVKATAQRLTMPIAVMILLLLYVVSLPRIGFDLATFLFIAGTLLAQGERRPLFIIIYSAIFSLLVVWAFKAMLTLDMPTLLI